MFLQSLQRERGDRGGGEGREKGEGGDSTVLQLANRRLLAQAVLWPAEVQSVSLQYVTIHDNSWRVLYHITYD